MKNYKITANQIRKMRKSMNLTQEQLGALVGLEGSNLRKPVNRWEAGDRTPSTSNIKKLIDVFIAVKTKQTLGLVKEKNPGEIKIATFSSKEEFEEFFGDDIPFWLQGELIKSIYDTLIKQGKKVSLLEIKKEAYLDWLAKKELPNTKESRALFVSLNNSI